MMRLNGEPARGRVFAREILLLMMSMLDGEPGRCRALRESVTGQRERHVSQDLGAELSDKERVRSFLMRARAISVVFQGELH